MPKESFFSSVTVKPAFTSLIAARRAERKILFFAFFAAMLTRLRVAGSSAIVSAPV